MKKAKIAVVAGTILGLTILNYAQGCIAQRSVENIPKLVRQTEDTRAKVRQIFSKGYVTKEEEQNLYWICRNARDSRVSENILGAETENGSRVTWELFNMRKDYREQGFNLKLDEALINYSNYLRSAEYRQLVGPKTFAERTAEFLKLALCS